MAKISGLKSFGWNWKFLTFWHFLSIMVINDVHPSAKLNSTLKNALDIEGTTEKGIQISCISFIRLGEASTIPYHLFNNNMLWLFSSYKKIDTNYYFLHFFLQKIILLTFSEAQTKLNALFYLQTNFPSISSVMVLLHKQKL
jgi:hypothetical protein